MGIFYFIYCDITNDFSYVIKLRTDQKALEDAGSDDYYSPNFVNAFMSDMTNFEKAIGITYFSFTSLSTVGFGDMHPRNDIERALTAFVLLFGVAIFSIILGNFIEMSDKFMKLNEEWTDGDNLSKFFGLIKQFNKGQDIKFELKN